MRLILTRPEKDAIPLAAKLAVAGHSCAILPLLEIVPRKDAAVPAKAYQAVCITSANGLANEGVLASVRHLPLYCVGPQSAAAGRIHGFERIEVHGGDVEGLAAFLVGHVSPGAGPLLYLSGAATSGDLEGKLRSHGFQVDRVVTYDAVATAPGDLLNAVSRADAVLLYSPRSAQLWRTAVEKAGATQHMRGMIHLCLSANVARALPGEWPRAIAESPAESAMLAALETLEPMPEQE